MRLLRRFDQGWNAIVYRSRELGHFTPGAKPLPRRGLLRARWIGRCSCGWESRTRREVNAQLDLLDHLSDSIREVDGTGIPGPERWPPGINFESTTEDWERAIEGQFRDR